MSLLILCKRKRNKGFYIGEKRLEYVLWEGWQPLYFKTSITRRWFEVPETGNDKYLYIQIEVRRYM